MKIVYIRQDSGVSIDGVGFFEPNKPVEVPDQIGEDLIKSGLFQEYKHKRR